MNGGGENIKSVIGTFKLLFFLSVVFLPKFSLAQRIESSFETKQSGSGVQEIHSHTQSDYGTYKMETEQHHKTETSGSTWDTQKVIYAGPDGKQYKETHGWEYDSFTEETKEWHRTEGEAPARIPEPDFSKIDEGGIKVDGKADGDSVESKYGPGGLEDKWSSGDWHWIDLNRGTSGHLDSENQTALEVEAPPARTIPLICRVAGLSGPPIELGIYPPNLVEEMFKNPEKVQEAMEKMQNQIEKIKSNFPKDQRVKISVEEVVWKKPILFWGFPVKPYAIFLGEGAKKKKRADIWTIPQIKLWNILKGKGKGSEKYIDHMLIPYWKGVSLAQQKKIFSSLVVLFIDYAHGTYYIAEGLEKMPQYVFQKPVIPLGYAVQKIDHKEIEAMGKEAQTLFWQGMNP